MKKTFSALVLIIIFFVPAKAQTNLKTYEDSLKQWERDAIGAESDSLRISANQKFSLLFEKALRIEGSFDYPFDSLKTVSKLNSPNKTFRLYTWALPSSDHNFYRYFGIIQYNDIKKKKKALYSLRDVSDSIPNPERAKGSNDQWYGAYYNKILLNKSFGKNYYTLLGWKGNDLVTTKKVIDILLFQGTKPVFGLPVFQLSGKDKNQKPFNRLIFEYSSHAVMSIRYEDNLKMIVYDHLSPSDSTLQGVFSAYGPDFTYNGLKFKRGKWMEFTDIDVRNPHGISDKSPKKRKKEVPLYKGNK